MTPKSIERIVRVTYLPSGRRKIEVVEYDHSVTPSAFKKLSTRYAANDRGVYREQCRWRHPTMLNICEVQYFDSEAVLREKRMVRESGEKPIPESEK